MFLIPVLLSYLIGAVPFGLIISRMYGISDIRLHGSGNIGATNVWRIVGGKAACWVFTCDILKGVAAVILAGIYYKMARLDLMSLENYKVLCGFTAIIGHVFPVYLKFKGGKGVNTALGVVASLMPIETLVGFVVFVTVLLIWKYVSLGSIMATSAISIFILIEKYLLHRTVSITFIILALILTLLIIVTHRKNIQRIIQGTENKFSFSSKKKR